MANNDFFLDHEVLPPFQTLVDASKATGLSVFYLRDGCKTGVIPCIKSGKKYLVNIPALLRKLDAESVREVR